MTITQLLPGNPFLPRFWFSVNDGKSAGFNCALSTSTSSPLDVKSLILSPVLVSTLVHEFSRLELPITPATPIDAPSVFIKFLLVFLCIVLFFEELKAC
jgi:hypothetical protein